MSPALLSPVSRHRLPRVWQRTLFCRCGQGTPVIAGLCRACYRARAHSRLRFGGWREEILARDHTCCRICGAGKSGRSLHVHHRKPGVQDPAALLTVCAACHARLHRRLAWRGWAPELLLALWREQQPGAPLQLQFPFDGLSSREWIQLGL